MKSDELKELFQSMSKCQSCLNLGNKSLKNIFSESDLFFAIPSIWTDWFNRLDSALFIVGQDWGPYEDMRKLNKRFQSGETWENLIRSENSLTKKNLEKFLNSISINLDDVFITNAIMCARSGSSYRGNDISLKYSSKCCSKYLKRQIEIVKPKVIITLGYYPLYSLSREFNFSIEDNLSDTILKHNIFKIDDYVIIPMFHPVAQVSHDEQLKRYQIIKDYL